MIAVVFTFSSAWIIIGDDVALGPEVEVMFKPNAISVAIPF
jgi:hypothetical protein